MPNFFRVTPIKPGIYDVSRVRGNIIEALRDEGRDTLLPLSITIQNWNDPPRMSFQITQTADMAMMEAGPTPKTSHQAKKWFWLNYGTRVRYARLSRDWVSKTSPGSLRSGFGRGQVLKRGYKAGRHKGIDPRGWVDIIEKMRAKRFRARIALAIATGLRVKKP